MGPDNITPYLLKIALPYIVESMTYVYSLCIEQNIFPTALKNAKVVPLPKSNDLSDPCNYRPISLLPVISKPLERYIHKHFLQYLENNKLIHQYQSGCLLLIVQKLLARSFLTSKKLLILWITLFYLRSSHFTSKTSSLSFFIIILQTGHNTFSLTTSHRQRD